MLKKSLIGVCVLATMLFGQVAFSGDENILAKFDEYGDPEAESICSDNGVTLTIDGELSADGISTDSYSTYSPNVELGDSGNSICSCSSTCQGNTIAGGDSNIIYSSDSYSCISGGYTNLCDSDYCTVGGGRYNQVTADYGTIAGGRSNYLSAVYAAVGGGYSNYASGIYSVIAGGYENEASGGYSFAAGRYATADEMSSFVWSDYGSVCNSDTYNQFKVCAANGAWFSNNVSAASYTDRTPYPDSLDTAYEAVLSMTRLPDEEYSYEDESKQLDHSTLTPFVYSQDAAGNPGRNLSATVSAQNEVIKDLISRIEQLESEVQGLKAACPEQ